MLKGPCLMSHSHSPPSASQSKRLPLITRWQSRKESSLLFHQIQFTEKKDHLQNIPRGTFHFVHNQIDEEHFTSKATKTQQQSNLSNVQARCELLAGSTDSKLRVLLTTLYIACIKTKIAW